MSATSPVQGRARIGAVSRGVARAIVFGVLLLALAGGLAARLLGSSGALVIRNDGQETLGVRFSHPPGPDGAAALPQEQLLGPGASMTTRFRPGSIIEAWPGPTRPDYPARWRIDAASTLLTLRLDLSGLEIAGDGARFVDLSGGG
jgi:hypothetical protein